MAFILTIIYILFTNHALSITQTVTLNATHESYSGVTITRNPDNVNTSNNIYHINPASQKSYDLLLSLTDTWTFNPSIPSTIELTLTGSTLPQSVQDGEFLMIFAINNTQYFSVVIRLDLQRNTWKYYPQTTNSNNLVFATTNDVYQDIIRGLQDNGTDSRVRWQRVSNNDQWADILPYYKQPLVWPFSIKLTSNPIQNSFLYQCILSDTILEFNYLSALLGDADINIYIMNDADDNKPFDIYSITITYTDRSPPISSIISSTSSPAESTVSTYDNTEIPASSVMPTTTTAATTSADGTETSSMHDTKVMAYDPGNSQSIDGWTVGAIIGIVTGCLVCLNLVIIGIYWLIKKRMEKVNDPAGLNKSEYYRPSVETTEIDEVLNQKRRESMVGGHTHDFGGGVPTARGVVPIRSQESDDDEIGYE